MSVLAQDMSYYSEEFFKPDATFRERREILDTIRTAKITGIGEFYHNALKLLTLRYPDVKTIDDRKDTEESVKMVCAGLIAEKYTAAAPDLWQIIQFCDVIYPQNDGLTMQDVLVAIGQLGGTQFVPQIVLRLHDFNNSLVSDVETKRRVQRAVVGCISALENLHDITGFRPVFFASVGWYDPAIKRIASVALPNIVEDPGEVIIELIVDPSNVPSIKYEAWREMLRTRAPDASKAKVAAVALAVGWNYTTPNVTFQKNLREMRMSAIDTIRMLGAADNSVYTNLEKSYTNNFINTVPDYDEIRKTVNALSALATDEAVNLLYNFLKDLNARRRSGPWSNKERQLLQWVIPALGGTRTSSMDVRLLLTTIQRSSDYTGAEQRWAADAIKQLGR